MGQTSRTINSVTRPRNASYVDRGTSVRQTNQCRSMHRRRVQLSEHVATGIEILVTRVPSERYATTRILLALVLCATMLLLGLSAAQIWLHA